MADSRTYEQKRDFGDTPEPAASFEGNVDLATARPGSFFMIHQHHATRLHFDLRLEFMNGDERVLASFAIPKNLPFKREPHLAVHVEDHPWDYRTFSGTIPKGNYGAGEVRIFDEGTFEVVEQGPGKLSIRLDGERVKGIWHLNRTRGESGKDEWLAILSKDERPEREPPPEPAPMLATLHTEEFDDDGWIFEPKWDGVRTLAVCTDETRLLSRRLNDVTETYPEAARLHEQLVTLEAIVDGEIVAFHEGRPSFERLQSRINLQNPREIERATASCPVTFIAFDILYLDGRSTIALPIEERKELLDRIVVPNGRVLVSPWVPGHGTTLAATARERKLEGIVAKKIGSPYRPGRRSKEWLKIKVVHDADVVIGGWTRGEGGRSSHFGALLVGAYDEDGELRFLGSVGTGFDQKLLDEMSEVLAEHASDECPFALDPTGLRSGSFGKPIRDPQWVEPVLVAQVEFRELTSGHRLRAPSFKRLRRDKVPEDCLLEDLVATT